MAQHFGSEQTHASALPIYVDDNEDEDDVEDESRAQLMGTVTGPCLRLLSTKSSTRQSFFP